MNTVLKSTLLVLLSCLALMAQNQKMKTINVDFKNSADGGQDISMSLPMSFLDSIRPQIENALLEIQTGENKLDFEAMWLAIRDAGPNQFLEIQQEENHIKLSTTLTHLTCNIQSDENGNISIKLPLALCDALFGNLKTLDYEKIKVALLALEGQDLVSIQSKTINGRVWIQ